jgi:hypothetical protein
MSKPKKRKRIKRILRLGKADPFDADALQRECNRLLLEVLEEERAE